MRAYWTALLLFTLIIMLSGYLVWPVLHPYMGEIRFWLIAFKRFCHAYPLLGYMIYGVLLAAFLFFGVPFTMIIMLLAGITYDFWEATMLVTVCRMGVAMLAFLLVRRMMEQTQGPVPVPALLKTFERHPKMGLLLARLSPLPDTTVNFAMGASSLGYMQYAAISLIGMIPLSLFCVWAGGRLGSVSHLIRVIN